ncbi:hypothetical protein AZOA_41740 [Azoarcus sp. Aa7]|nr:hypothetical protein [Azoarcus sp. Aa7]
MKGTLMTSLAAAALLANGAHADPGTDLSVRLEVLRVLVQPDGRETATAAGQARPGELLEYRAHYGNAGQVATRQVTATLPLPAGGVVFIPGSAHPAGAEASTDGKHFETMPLQRWVVLPDGRRELRPVPAEEYRSLRWKLGDLAPRQAMTVSARVRVAAAAGGGQ